MASNFLSNDVLLSGYKFTNINNPNVINKKILNVLSTIKPPYKN